jgi:hypothetical protein
LITIGIFSAKNTLQGYIENYKTDAEVVSIETDTTHVSGFNSIEVLGEGRIKIVHNSENYFTSGSRVKYEIKDACLYINPNYDVVVLSLSDLHKITAKDDVQIDAQSFVADTVYLQLSDDASVRLYSCSMAYTEIRADDNAELEIKESLIKAGKIVLHNDAQMFLINTPINDLDFEQNDDSELKFRGKSKVGSKNNS